ncbi:D-alanine--D-alanine ligase [Geosporobacter ferrireducens]|uniref:D-alanine--D-alanine ligase n=1 Tax=Geosporobacter ferrireducens TaxID=1424294 RepID=A0A1D8GH08_9FIRM|nr:D-alanine--D-alanine ligase [Geosporobacter ferrireducens]AOT70173.1 D-alanine--D-alanine ligase A [Geosporobacter ferrireducens]MTI53281.1 D-alanine--D-alanine ligase [Geosporobacter ferrireducens]
MTKKLNIGIIFGGKSGEHEVSLMSAASVMRAMDREKYNIIPIGITNEGSWMLYNGPIEKIESGEWEGISNKLLQEDPQHSVFTVIPMGNEPSQAIVPGIPPYLGEQIDVIFPVLHGPYGEDGTIQGLLEMADIPYVGAGVLASAVGMDKIYSKRIFEMVGLPMGKYMLVMRKKLRENPQVYVEMIEENFSYPVFIKPANLGSSVGISKARNQEELLKGLQAAARHDRKILVEEFIACRELECAVLGNDEPKASVVGEIIPSHEFYDYEAKYFDDGKSKMIIPADIPAEKAMEIREMAIKAYKAIDCSGLARVDFFMEKETMKIYINEINTMPGFTKYSMYPLLWDAAGLPYPQLIDQLIQLAVERHQDK